MKDYVVGNCLAIIKSSKDYDDVKLAEIKYGLETIYIFLSKSIVIFTVAFFLGIIKELFIFTIFYNIIRMPSFGLHATKSWICLVSSLMIFITIPFICTHIYLTNDILFIIGIICTILIFNNSPADTYKRPIIDKNRRLVYKLISTLISILYVILALVIDSSFMSNVLILSLVLQCFMTAPTVYKLFNLPYNNYLNYIPKLS